MGNLRGELKTKGIRVIDGATLYAMVTGEKDALKEVYEMLFPALQAMNKRFPERNKNWIRKLYEDCYPT